ncbi:hypothetical protein AAFN87_12235 [Solibacillus sp. CAU 1738]
MAFFITPGTPIKPGEAITPGDAIIPGQPITGGQFIIPGEVFQPGNAIQGGKPYQPGSIYQGGNAPVSGQPIIPGTHIQIGQFIIPNIAGSLPINNNWLVTSEAITGGNAIEGGNALNGGNGPGDGTAINGGNISTGGEGPNGGNVSTGGEGPNGGNVSTGGGGPNGGNVSTGGEGPNGGNVSTGGEGPNGGNVSTGGEGPNGGNGSTGGEGPNGGNVSTGGEGPNGGNVSTGGEGPNGSNSSTGGEDPNGSNSSTGGRTSGEETISNIPSTMNIIFNSTDTSRGPLGVISGILKDGKRFITSFGKNFSEGMAATYAGFRFDELKSGKYKVQGNASLKNPIMNYFYDNYKKYKIDNKSAYMPAGKTNPKQYKIDSFFESKKFTQFGSAKDFLGSTWKSVKSGLNDGFNIFSKSFRSKSNVLKLNGPVSIATSAFNSVYDYGWGTKSDLGFSSSNFHADLTVDLAIGAGTTVLSSIASSITAGAVAGSVVPGLGTVAGAVAGLLVGIGTSYLIHGTNRGRNIKKWASDGLSKIYSKGAEKVKGFLSGTKKLFGFGS